jgi:hypothetical protein
MRRLLVVGIFLEIGIVLLFVPWSDYWNQNYFVELLPLATSNFVRGAISGLGVINLVAGLAELASIVGRARAAHRPTSITAPRQATED